jgi:hypothetical protein
MDDGTLRSLNNKLLASQFLTQRARDPEAIVKVAEACCGINSQDFLESFDSFWSRVDHFQDSKLLSELRPKGGLVRTYTVRGTMHTIPSKDFWIHVRGSPYRRFASMIDRVAERRGLPERSFRTEKLYEPFLNRIKGRSATTNEIKNFMVGRLDELGFKGKMKLMRGWSSTPSYGPAWTGIAEMAYMGLIVNTGRKGSESLWMSAKDWFGSKQKIPDTGDCMVQLVRKYIESYGPVSLQDITYWTFLLKSDVVKALEALKEDLTVESFGSKQEYYSIERDDVSAPVPNVIILPEFDSLMMGYKDKSRFLANDHLKKIFWGLGGIHRTILVDGFVSAFWKRKKSNKEMMIDVKALRDLTQREKRSIDEAFQSYAEYKETSGHVQFG